KQRACPWQAPCFWKWDFSGRIHLFKISQLVDGQSVWLVDEVQRGLRHLQISGHRQGQGVVLRHHGTVQHYLRRAAALQGQLCPRGNLVTVQSAEEHVRSLITQRHCNRCLPAVGQGVAVCGRRCTVRRKLQRQRSDCRNAAVLLRQGEDRH